MMIQDYKHLIGLQHPYGTNAVKVCESEMMKWYYNHNKNLKVYTEQVCNDMIKYK